jgi:hypothetical protein
VGETTAAAAESSPDEPEERAAVSAPVPAVLAAPNWAAAAKAGDAPRPLFDTSETQEIIEVKIRQDDATTPAQAADGDDSTESFRVPRRPMRRLAATLVHRVPEAELRELVGILQRRLGIPRPAPADDALATCQWGFRGQDALATTSFSRVWAQRGQ